MRKTTQIGLASAFVVASIGGYAFGTAQNVPVRAAVDPAATSQCQYPERDSNPQDGCDNSDPAIPECLGKTGAGEQACLAYVDQCLKGQTTLQACVEQYRQSLQPVIEPSLPAPVVETPPTTPVTCLEK